MNKPSLLFALLYFSVSVAACLTVAFMYHRHHRRIVALSHKYCYVYKSINGQPVSDNVLLVPTEYLAKKTIDYYKTNGNAIFNGDITASVSPFTKVEVLGHGADNSIIKIRVLYDKDVHEDISSSEGYVPLMTLHDTLPRIRTTVHDYRKSTRF